MLEDFLLMGSIRKLTAEILAGEVQEFVHARAPLRTIGDVVDYAKMGYPHASTAFAGVSFEVKQSDEVVRSIHK